MMLHKFRRAMVNLEREPLRGEVEVDDTWIGGPQAGPAGKPATERPESGPRRRRGGEARKSLRTCADGLIPDFKSVISVPSSSTMWLLAQPSTPTGLKEFLPV